jgi:2-polyprenyl-3-methyl-5-hydroxy-6-metoxy-1,4-benzoquinol methylase
MPDLERRKSLSAGSIVRGVSPVQSDSERTISVATTKYTKGTKEEHQGEHCLRVGLAQVPLPLTSATIADNTRPFCQRLDASIRRRKPNMLKAPILRTLFRSRPVSSTVVQRIQDLQNGQIKDEHFRPVHGLELEPYIKSENISGIHHLGRYTWAVEVLKQRSVKRVLDAACGAGYGSFMLASALPDAMITGADYDERAVADARQSYQRSNLQFVAGSVTQWKLGEFDAIVSFETIEHVPHREIMMQNIVEHLSDDGCLLLSTPCGRREVDLQPDWHFHKIEYSASTLHDFMRRYFKTVRHPEAANLPAMQVFERINRDVERYNLKMNPLLCEGPIRYR